ncbi:polyhydroxyalkanoate synthesis regulator DNA-binding domain-containing protein [Candidatus Lariskella endosymbiont of Hedychridium roseum]|uniref:polyhydroxyalkanoate synthesis regulator DNA-binding domain-containing protein n=1 Tax=Candidatus Lariskella endosymbiont of Hedychridium roseum TaxID=3077949 RepID=UPI0030D0EEC6
MNNNSTVTIKKYPNRRLYNTTSSTYITLDDLASLVREDRDILVIDAKTGRDITHVTLINVILEYQGHADQILPINCLRQVIKLQGNSLGSVLTGYLSLSMDYFQKNQQYIENFINAAMNNSSSMDLWMQNMNFFQQQNENFLHMIQGAAEIFVKGLQTQREKNSVKKSESEKE